MIFNIINKQQFWFQYLSAKKLLYEYLKKIKYFLMSASSNCLHDNYAYGPMCRYL